MSQEPSELVALKRAMGRQLAASRQAAEIGQQQVVHKTGYSRSSIAHAEAGRQLLTREFWKTADELVKAEGALLTSYERVHAARQEYERRSRGAELAEAYTQARVLRDTTTTRLIPDSARLAGSAGPDALARVAAAAGVARGDGLAGPLLYLAFLSNAAHEVPAEWRDQVYDQLTRLLREWAKTRNRREILQVLGWAATTVTTAPVSTLDTEEQESLVWAGRPQEAIDSASRGLRLFDNSFAGSLAFCTLRLGTSHLLSGEVEEAAQVINGGPLLATKNRSARLTNGIRAARVRMQPWQDMPVVRALDERLVGWGVGLA